MADDLADLDFNINIGGGQDYNNFFTQNEENESLTGYDKQQMSQANDLESASNSSSIFGQISSLFSGSNDKAQPSLNNRQAQNSDIGIFSSANHPIACLFHILFKGISMFCTKQISLQTFSHFLLICSFIFLNIFLGNDIMTFIFIIIFTAIDFWVVKNITGRILVNLRWWSEIDEDGNENWVYESDEDQNRPVGTTDSLVFWTALYLTPVIWGFFAFMDFISFKFFWMNACIICATLSSINVSGYYNCKQDHKSKISSFIQEKTMSYFLGNYMGSALGGMKSMVASKLPIPSFLSGLVGGNPKPAAPQKEGAIFSDADRQYY